MKVIGITGPVGSGKSALLSLIEERVNCRVITADLVANQMKEPGGMCYNEMISLLGEDASDKERFAKRIFSDDALRRQVNAVIHPAVKAYVRDAIATERAMDVIDVLFIEAALLIEDGYAEIVDEMWVITAPADVRRMRLREARGYTDEKTDSILSAQMTDEEYAVHADLIIQNAGTLEEAFAQVEERLAHLH